MQASTPSLQIETGFTILPLLFALILFIFSVCAFAFWIWMLVECLTKESSEGNDKIVWVLVIIFTNLIGALIYFLVRRPERNGMSLAEPPRGQ